MSGKRISTLNVKKEFSFVGLILISYIILFLIMPQVILLYFQITESEIFNNDFLFFGIYYIFVILSIIPFLILMKSANIKFKNIIRYVHTSFLDLFSQTLVFFTLSTLAIYLFNTISVWFGYSGRLISNIGNILVDAYLLDGLYAFMFIIACPIIEEIIFRGILLSYLKRYGKRFALYCTTTIYALAHIFFSDIITTYVMGILLARTALRYKSIQPTIVIHILFNLLIYILCIVPNDIANYIWLGLLVVYIISIILVITKRYNLYSVPSSSNTGTVEKLFYSRFTIIIAIILLILKSLLFLFTQNI